MNVFQSLSKNTKISHIFHSVLQWETHFIFSLQFYRSHFVSFITENVIAWVFLKVISFTKRLYKWCRVMHLYIIRSNDSQNQPVWKTGDKIPDKLIRVEFPKSLTVLLLFKDQSRCISLSPLYCPFSHKKKVFITRTEKLPCGERTKKLMLGDTNK